MQDRTSRNLNNEPAHPPGVAIPPEEIEAELKKILSSPTFSKAPRHSGFLSFVVWKALAGEGESIKEYLIGLEVFERPADYDPATDPIVRAEARRLRSRLIAYYNTEGKLDPVHIELPKGTYVPVFSHNGVEPPLEEVSAETDSAKPLPSQGAVVPPVGASRRPWLAAATYVIVAAIVVAYFALRKPVRLTDKDSIVLADFDNKTGDAVFDDTLKTALKVALNQSPFLNVLPDKTVAATLQLMDRPANSVLTPEVARELCQRANAKAYVAGSIAASGKSYLLTVKALNCLNGDLLAQEQVTATAKETVLGSLGQAAAKLRGQLGESLATVQEFDVPLQQATTSSLEALKAYSVAFDVGDKKGNPAGLPYLQRAIQFDPNFAMAYMQVGGYYFSVAELERANEYYTRAFQLREHASEREKLAITANYYANVTGEWDKAAETYEELIKLYPRYSGSYVDVAVVYAAQGQYERALERNRQAQRLIPDRVIPYEDIGLSLLALNRFDEARRTIREARAKKFDDFLLHTELYALAFLGADSTAVTEQQQWYATKPEFENLGLALASDTEAYNGHLKKAEELTRQSVDSATKADSKESGAIWQENAAVRDAAFGKATQAQQAATAGMKLAPASQGVELEAALTFAMAGDIERAESLVRDLNQRFPLDTQVQSLWLPAIRAQIALDRKNPAAALEDVRTVVPPLGLGQIMFVNNISCLYPTYVRGQSYLAAGQGQAAAADFQQILDHRGIVWNCWTGALAHLGLARANALQSRNSLGAEADAARVRARTDYKDFLTLWKDADPDIPILKQAKAEYAKLK